MKRLLLSSVFIYTLSAHASILVPPTAPDCCAPDPLFLGSGSTLLASLVDQPFVSVLGAQDFGGTYSEWAYANTGNTFGSGDISLILQVSSNASSGETINRVTASSFAGLETDVGLSGAGAGVVPFSVDRTSPGPVGFNVDLFSGQTTALLQIDTNGRFVVPGNVSIINDGTSTNPGFSAGIPEPATWTLLLLGTAAFGLLGYRRTA